MTKKLFLCSVFSNVANLLPKFQPHLAGLRATFIPTASKAESFGFLVRLEKRTLKKMGIIVDELDLTSALKSQIRAKILNNDLIYISGGNTFYLLQELKRTSADRLIIKAVNSGTPYIGESAGAVITAPNIKFIHLMDSVKKAPDLTDFNALNLVDFSPLPHVKSFPFKKATQQIIEEYESVIDLKTMNNQQAILVNGDQIIS